MNPVTMFRGDEFVTPLYNILPGEIPELGGTGTWLQVGFEKFLITAAHVIDTGFVWFPMVHGFRRLSSPGVRTSIPANGNVSDKADFAIFHLNVGDAAVRHPYHRYIQMDEVEVDLAYQQGTGFEFTGFPYRKQKLDHRKKITSHEYMSVISEAVDEATFSKLALSIHTHVVILFNRKNMLVDGHRTIAALPHGMSGGAVWKRYPNSEVRKLAAIANEYRHDCLIGTRISGVLEYVRAQFPDLSPLIPEPRNVEIRATKNGKKIEPL